MGSRVSVLVVTAVMLFALTAAAAAQTIPPPVTAKDWSTALVLSGLTNLIFAALGVAQLYNALKRKPPLDQELQLYAKKSDVAMVDQRLRDEIANHAQRHERIMEKHQEDQARTIDNIFTRLNYSQKAIEETFRQIMHELGKLTGRVEKKG